MNSSRWLGILLGIMIGSVAFQSTEAYAQELLWKELGTNAGDLFGWPVAFAGDADGDGFSDVLSAALHSDCNATNSGRVALLQGNSGSEYQAACGLSSADLFGDTIDGNLDIDQDGRADFIIGAGSDDRNGNGAGAFMIYSGATGGILREVLGSTSSESLGAGVASIADIDADGIRDYVVGADTSTPGAEFATVFSALTGSVLLTLLPAVGSNSFGSAVADAGDVNADGITDIIVGDLSGDGATINGSGHVRVFSGLDGSVLHDLDGEHTDSDFGWAVDGLGDVNLDGFADFIVGSPDFIDFIYETGKIYVYSGQDGALLFSDIGDDVLDFRALGYSVSGAGDVNHDGYPDYLAGDPVYVAEYANGGAVRLYSGRNGLRLYHWEGDATANTIGFSLDGGSDVDGDGCFDVAIGMFEDDTNGIDAGAAAVYAVDHDFYVDATPKKQYDGGNYRVSLQIAQTAPGNLIALAYTAIDGSPFFAFLAIAAADSLGSLTLSGKVPTGLGGHDVDFQAFAIGFNGKLVVSNVEHLEFL